MSNWVSDGPEAFNFPREHGESGRVIPAGVKPEDVPLDTLDGLVGCGSTIVIGGTMAAGRPMAALRQLIRANVRDLHMITGGGGLETDLLIAAGAIRRLTFCYVSLAPFGIAPAFRAGINSGAVEYDLVSGQMILTGLDAAARRVPFLPATAIDAGAPYLEAVPHLWAKVDSPFSDQAVMIVGALEPDVAILHAEAIDDYGNAQLPLTIASDFLLAMAAKRTIVTYERRVSGRLSAADRFLARAYIDATAHAPGGAHPTSFAPHYGFDVPWFEKYLDTPGAPEEEVRRVREMTEADYMAQAFPEGGDD